MPCPSSIYCISNTGVPLYNDSYEDTLTNYNGAQYYTGQTNGLFIYYSSGDTQWCLSDTLGGTCYLSGKSPCSTTCPDLCDELFTTGSCPTPTPTPTNNCSSLDFAALFDCDLPPTPTVTPTSTVTPTVTVTPTSSSICPVSYIDATIYSVSPSPTPTRTPTPTPSVMVERDCTFSGSVTYDMINDDIVCPFSYEFQDCFDQGKKYYTFDTLENPSGGDITQFMVFNATVLEGGTSVPKNKCIHYVGINTQISGTDHITLLTGPYGFANQGQCNLCDIVNTPTPTPTHTVTPTITLTPTMTNTPSVTPTLTPTITPTTQDSENIVICNETITSGGIGINDKTIMLDNPNGGVVIVDFMTGDWVDKLEIIHVVGTNYVKKATSSVSLTGNYGPFDNTYGTRPTNILPTTAQANATAQFIGTQHPPILSRMSEFYTDTGIASPLYPITPAPSTNPTWLYQRVWWKYTASDYTTSTTINIRVVGASNHTGWNYKRICLLPYGISLSPANCKVQGSCNNNETCGVRLPVVVSNAPSGYYVSMTVLSSTNATATYFGGNVTYTESTSVGSSATIKLDLYDTFGGTLLDTTTETITHQSNWGSLPNC